jgi:hypothetical protein
LKSTNRFKKEIPIVEMAKSRRNNRNNRKTRKNMRRRRNMRGGAGCGSMPPSSLAQGQAFQRMTANFHGGGNNTILTDEYMEEPQLETPVQTGGASDPGAFPFTDARLLDGSARTDAQIAPLDKAIAELPSLTNPVMKGGAYGDDASPVSAPGMLLSGADYGRAGLSPQWETENLVNPAFNGKGGKRSRKNRKASRKHRKASRKNRKAGRR